MKRLFIGLVALFLVFGTVAACTQPAEAATVKAVPIIQNQIVIYQDDSYRTEIARTAVPVGTCSTAGKGQYWDLDASYIFKISSVLFWNPTNISTCNSLWVHNTQNQWWGKCISRHDWGIGWFGPGYNDAVWEIWIGWDPKCPRWTV